MRKFLLSCTALTGALILAGCEEPREFRTCAMMEDYDSSSECGKSKALAEADHKKTAPVYKDQKTCEEAHGDQKLPNGQPICQQRTVWTNSDGEVITMEEAQTAQAKGQPVTQTSGTSPIFWYWLGTMNSGGNNAGYGAPLYPSRGGGYYTQSGARYDSIGATYRSYPSSVSTNGSRPTVTHSVTRQGFGGGGRGFGG